MWTRLGEGSRLPGGSPRTGTELRCEQWAMASPRPCPQQGPPLKALPGQGGQMAAHLGPGRGGPASVLPAQHPAQHKDPNRHLGANRHQQKGLFISELN